MLIRSPAQTVKSICMSILSMVSSLSINFHITKLSFSLLCSIMIFTPLESYPSHEIDPQMSSVTVKALPEDNARCLEAEG